MTGRNATLKNGLFEWFLLSVTHTERRELGVENLVKYKLFKKYIYTFLVFQI